MKLHLGIRDEPPLILNFDTIERGQHQVSLGLFSTKEMELEAGWAQASERT